MTLKTETQGYGFLEKRPMDSSPLLSVPASTSALTRWWSRS